ncbi:phosphodiester glycosidase family protein [Bauldia litoralis]|uniref:phosphodiester glycosidase family protein n=1 Tax=Bauldia litoralis TaxID=665467 RepID=UPI0032670FB8
MTSRPSHSRRRFALVAALIAMGIAAPSTSAQTTKPAEKPEPDLALILESSRAAENSELLPGLDHRTIALPADGLAVHVFAFDTSRFGLRTVEQHAETGSRALDFLAGPGDVFAINGGFFERDDDGRLSPSGLLVVDGVTVVMEHERAGSGVLHVGVGAASISYRADAPAPGALKSAVQVGPILVDPGGKVGIRSQGVRDRRSALCLRHGAIIAVVADSDGLSLLRLAELLAAPTGDGGVGCDIAINLDGGPSTQAIWRGDTREIVIPGGSTVQNAIVLSKLPQ